MTFTPEPFGPRTLGRTGLRVGPLGVAASYGVPAAAVEKAVEHGLNYLYWGSVRRPDFGRALRTLAGRRERFVLVLQSYSPFAWGIRRATERGLSSLGLDHADVLLLGYWSRRLPSRVVDECRRLKERGLVGHVGLSTHRRSLVADLATDGDLDLFHVRYNAVHTGAERDVFERLPAEGPPGIVAYTATSWRQLLDPRRVPAGEKVPTAGDCYRFVLSNPSVHLCMSGPANAEQMDHAIEAMGLGPMTVEELAWMRRVGQAIYQKKR